MFGDLGFRVRGSHTSVSDELGTSTQSRLSSVVLRDG